MVLESRLNMCDMRQLLTAAEDKMSHCYSLHNCFLSLYYDLNITYVSPWDISSHTSVYQATCYDDILYFFQRGVVFQIPFPGHSPWDH
jgi:hypothetical protein